MMTNNRSLTTVQYCDYRIINYQTECSRLLRGGRSFQPNVVEVAAKVEGERLPYEGLGEVSSTLATD